MPRQCSLRIVMAALAVLAVRPLQADSDGYFCATSSYLAYEVRFAGASVSHELRVVSLASPLSQDSLQTIPLPEFQVHGMLCTDEKILVLGWDTLYTAELLPDMKRPSLRSETLAYPGSRPSPFSKTDSTGNLGILAEQVTAIGGSKSKFFLITELEPLARECHFRVLSRLEEVDDKGQALFALQLYDGWGGIACGE